MPYGLYLSAEGAAAQARRMEVISHNLANVDTTGFKRDLAVCQARYAETTARGLDEQGSGTINDLGGGVAVRETKTDFSNGPMQHTGLPTDLAINGRGFFMIRKPEGDFLSRAGNFSLSGTGQLVTQEGYPVLDDAGTPVVITPDAPWTFTPDGGVLQAGSRVNLALVEPESLGQLQKVGENLFAPGGELLPIAQGDRSVARGFIERSGVKPTLEMMDLIEASRAFEANVTLIKHQDQMIGGLTSRVLRA
ncbi:MAG: flagellar basal-body rod protein FlgF [Pirellulales bacterium]|nr:flagellar basal-body rod protein FlgF [Pirellulales bacterium]